MNGGEPYWPERSDAEIDTMNRDHQPTITSGRSTESYAMMHDTSVFMRAWAGTRQTMRAKHVIKATRAVQNLRSASFSPTTQEREDFSETMSLKSRGFSTLRATRQLLAKVGSFHLPMVWFCATLSAPHMKRLAKCD